jgi:phage protein U
MNTYLKIGPHGFSILPMSYQTLGTKTGIHLPAINRFGNDDVRQFTGRPSPEFTIDGLLFPKELGGKDEYDAMRVTQARGQAVMMIGLAASIGTSFGRVMIENVSDTQEEIDIDGLGKMVKFSVSIAGVPGTFGTPGGLF